MSKYKTIDIAWNDLSCSVPSKTDPNVTVEILKNVSGTAAAGQVTSIMGPSGAGKTTMMDLLAGRLQRISEMSIKGEVLVNNEPIDYRRFRHSTGYVTQHDYLPPTETVRECLMFSAQLRLSSGLTHAQRRQRVDSILDELSLMDCANTFIGSPAAGIKGVSGGEKRRVSVGVELITSPTCLFLDEPTSGLDSEIAVAIMRTLKAIAAKGRTVALTIHQPNSDITELFDHFILMARGQILYGGAWKLAVTAFADAGFPCPQFKNPTDYFLGVASEAENIPELVDRQSNRWNASVRRSFVGADEGMGAVTIVDGDASIRSTGKSLHSLHTYGAARVSKNDLEAAHHEGPPTSIFAQMMCLSARFMRAWQRHPIMLVGEAVQYLFMGAFIGGMYFDVSSEAERGTFDRAASSFFIIVTIVFTPPFTVITVWQDERTLVRREVDQNIYGLGVFFWSKTLVMVPVEILFALTVSVISYFMFGYQMDVLKFFIFASVLALALLVSESLGMVFAMICKTADIAIVLASILFIILLSLTGFMTSNMPKYYSWIQDVSFMRYANSAMFLNEMNGLTLRGPSGEALLGEDLAAANEIDNDLSVGVNLAILTGMLVVVRVAAYVGLLIARRQNWL